MSDSLNQQLQFKSHIPVHAWELVLFPLQSPLLASPQPLPAISRANLKLRYYDSCTRRVGGRFRTSTPSINPLMGPTSWLNHPVLQSDNSSSDEAKLRSCNYTQTFLLSVSPLAKNLFWWLFDSPFQLLPWSLGISSQQQPLYQKLYSCFLSASPYEDNYKHLKTSTGRGSLWFLLADDFVSVAVCFTRCFGLYFCWKKEAVHWPFQMFLLFALCGSLRWVISHQNTWPTNKQTNKHTLGKPWVIVL